MYFRSTFSYLRHSAWLLFGDRDIRGGPLTTGKCGWLDGSWITVAERKHFRNISHTFHASITIGMVVIFSELIG